MVVESKGWETMQLGLPYRFAISIMKNINDFFLSWKHGNLYKFEEILHVHEEIHVWLGIRWINKSFVWQSTSPQYNQPTNEWEENLDNED